MLFRRFRSQFDQRASGVEMMDDLELGGEVMQQTLDQLAVVNRFLGGNDAWRAVSRLLTRSGFTPQGPLVIADVGCGGGENLCQIADWGRKQGISMQLIGFDANPHVIAYATQKAQAYPEISFEVADVTHSSFLARRVDILTCSLFLHHLPSTQLEDLLPAYLNMTRVGLIVSDLQRHWLPWILFGLVVRVFRASPMIRHDGLLSIRRGFTRQDLADLFQRMPSTLDMRWVWAFRYEVLAYANSQ